MLRVGHDGDWHADWLVDTSHAGRMGGCGTSDGRKERALLMLLVARVSHMMVVGRAAEVACKLVGLVSVFSNNNSTISHITCLPYSLNLDPTSVVGGFVLCWEVVALEDARLPVVIHLTRRSKGGVGAEDQSIV